MRKAIVFIFLCLFILSPKPMFAQEPTPVPKVDYPLPYPGLLEDNPLYSLKVVRDKVVQFLITDPLKKAEFSLLQSDKRLSAAQYLFNKQEVSLAESTASKSIVYLEDAVVKVGDAKKQGVDVKETVAKIVLSSKKHQEVIQRFSDKTSGVVHEQMEKYEQKAVEIEKIASKLSSQQ